MSFVCGEEFIFHYLHYMSCPTFRFFHSVYSKVPSTFNSSVVQLSILSHGNFAQDTLTLVPSSRYLVPTFQDSPPYSINSYQFNIIHQNIIWNIETNRGRSVDHDGQRKKSGSRRCRGRWSVCCVFVATEMREEKNVGNPQNTLQLFFFKK
jgi:hypothetical protein